MQRDPIATTSADVGELDAAPADVGELHAAPAQEQQQQQIEVSRLAECGAASSDGGAGEGDMCKQAIKHRVQQ